MIQVVIIDNLLPIGFFFLNGAWIPHFFISPTKQANHKFDSNR